MQLTTSKEKLMDDALLIGVKFAASGQHAEYWRNFASNVQLELPNSVRDPARFCAFEGTALVAYKWHYLHRFPQDFASLQRNPNAFNRELVMMQKSAQEFRRVYYGEIADVGELISNYVRTAAGSILHKEEDPQRDDVDVDFAHDSRDVRPEFVAKLRKRLAQLFVDPNMSSLTTKSASVLAFPAIVNGEAYALCDVAAQYPTEFVTLNLSDLSKQRRRVVLEFLEDVVFAMASGPQRYLDVNILAWKQWLYDDSSPKFQLILTGQFYGSIESYYEALYNATPTFQTPDWIIAWRKTGVRPKDETILLGCMWQVFSFLALSLNNLSKHGYSDQMATYDPSEYRRAEFFELVSEASKQTPFLERAYEVLMNTSMKGTRSLTDTNELIRNLYVRYAVAPRVRKNTAERYPDPPEEESDSSELAENI